MKIARLVSAVLLSLIAYAGFCLPNAVASDDGSDKAGIQCAQETFPWPLAGATVDVDGFPNKAAAQAALANPDQLLATALASNLFGGMTCPGCDDGQPGCFAYINMRGQVYTTQLIRLPNGTWRVRFILTAGTASFGCWSCPE